MQNRETAANREQVAYLLQTLVDDTLSAMPDSEAASEFLTTLNKSHPSIDFTMVLEDNGRLPFSEWTLSGMVAT